MPRLSIASITQKIILIQSRCQGFLFHNLYSLKPERYKEALQSYPIRHPGYPKSVKRYLRTIDYDTIQNCLTPLWKSDVCNIRIDFNRAIVILKKTNKQQKTQ